MTKKWARTLYAFFILVMAISISKITIANDASVTASYSIKYGDLFKGKAVGGAFVTDSSATYCRASLVVKVEENGVTVAADSLTNSGSISASVSGTLIEQVEMSSGSSYQTVATGSAYADSVGRRLVTLTDESESSTYNY